MPQQLVPESKQSSFSLRSTKLCVRKGRQSCLLQKNGRHHVANLTCCNSAFAERFGIKLISASSGD